MQELRLAREPTQKLLPGFGLAAASADFLLVVFFTEMFVGRSNVLRIVYWHFVLFSLQKDTFTQKIIHRMPFTAD